MKGLLARSGGGVYVRVMCLAGLFKGVFIGGGPGCVHVEGSSCQCQGGWHLLGTEGGAARFGAGNLCFLAPWEKKICGVEEGSNVRNQPAQGLNRESCIVLPRLAAALCQLVEISTSRLLPLPNYYSCSCDLAVAFGLFGEALFPRWRQASHST